MVRGSGQFKANGFPGHLSNLDERTDPRDTQYCVVELCTHTQLFPTRNQIGYIWCPTRKGDSNMSNSLNVDALIDGIIRLEGDFSDHPADRGGPTRWGVTEAVARAHGYSGDMRDFPRPEAASIYKGKYWHRPGFDRVARLAPHIAAELFDTGINMGTGTASGFLQRALNALNRSGRDYQDIAVDHRIGPETLAALAAFLQTRGAPGEAVLHKAIEALQGARYITLAETRPANEAFLYGWLANRID